MLKVPIGQAVPGMRLAVSLHHPHQPGRVLLKPGFCLDASAIGRLREIEVRELWIRYPRLDFVEEYINPAVNELRHELVAALDQTFERVADNGQVELEYEQFKFTIDELITQFVDQPRAALYIDEICTGGKTHIAHAGNVCALSLLMGLKLRGYLVAQRPRLSPRHATNIVSLGVGAMLCDIGMLRLDWGTLDRWGRTGDESDERWRRHVTEGYEMVRTHVGPSAASIVLNHHQYYDGSGFPEKDEPGTCPRGRRGTEIPVFTRIVTVADAYDRLRNPPDGSGPRPAVAALGAMHREPLRARYDPMVFKALVSVAPPYPPGVIVELSDGRSGVVIGWSPADPCRPDIVLIDAPADHYNAGDGKIPRLSLRERKDLTIVVADGMDVAAHNFFAVGEDGFDVDTAQARQWRTLSPTGFDAA